MTIHSDWGRLLHSECPEAFLNQIPTDVDFGVGVIDGHLQLMCLHSGLGTWERFLQFLFVNPIKKLFDAGCPVVVLCFDSYDSVPVYKTMTQQKRISSSAAHKIPPVDEKEEGLPPGIPQDAMAYMMIRSFKLKVIDMVCACLPDLIMPLINKNPGQRFILDYKRVVEYDHGVPVVVEDMAPTGESDIKFARYVDRFGNALVHAIDGDYMAIALLYYAMRGLRHKIFIFRQLAQLAPTAADRKQLDAAEQAKKKRKITSSTTETTHPNGTTTAAAVATKKKKTPKCWVDMQLIFISIANSVRQARIPELRGGANNDDIIHDEKKAVHAAVVLMLCAGTDFSRPVPQIGPKRIWEALPFIVENLLLAAPVSGPINYTLFINGVVGPLYSSIFGRHVKGKNTATFNTVMAHLRHSSLSATTTGRLPSEAQVQTTLKNINWVVHHYWTVINGSIEAPLDGSNGFVTDGGGKVGYADVAVNSS